MFLFFVSSENCFAPECGNKIKTKFFMRPSLLLFTKPCGQIKVFCTKASTGYLFSSTTDLKIFCETYDQGIREFDFDAEIVCKVYVAAENEALLLARKYEASPISLEVARYNTLVARQGLDLWLIMQSNIFGTNISCNESYLKKSHNLTKVYFLDDYCRDCYEDEYVFVDLCN
jgi:hypothetical protein